MTTRLDRVADLTDHDRAAIRAVSQAVYPPGAPGPSTSLEWTRPDRCIRVHVDGELVSCAGALIRAGTHDARPARIGGMGGVMTHPNARRKGHAEAAIQRAIEFFADESADFALLVCRPHLLDYYGRLGWHRFEGELLVEQQGQRTPFTFNRVMTRAVRREAPTTGTIDLCGLPW